MISDDILTAAYIRVKGGERFGQAVYNAAVTLFPDKVKGYPEFLDPFYNDTRAEAFLDYLDKVN